LCCELHRAAVALEPCEKKSESRNRLAQIFLRAEKFGAKFFRAL